MEIMEHQMDLIESIMEDIDEHITRVGMKLRGIK